MQNNIIELSDKPYVFSIRKAMETPLSPTDRTVEEADAIIAKLDNEFCEAQQAQEQAKLMREALLDRLSEYEISLSKHLDEPKPLVARSGAIIGSRGNLSAIVGEAKSKKSFLCTAIIGDMLALRAEPTNGFDKRAIKTLWIDTEQSELHVRKVARRLTQLTHWNDPDRVHPLLKIYALREEPPKKRMAIVRDAIEGWRPKMVVIDGVADLQNNTNDLEESERIVTELMALSTIYECHILCVLHTNPNSDKARGHVGSALQRKAETVMYVHRVGDVSVVEPQFCRNEPFERFAFAIDNREFDLGLPIPHELPIASEESQANQTTAVVVEILRENYGGAVERNVLISKLEEQCGLSRTTAYMRISRAIKRGELIAKGKLVYCADYQWNSNVAEQPTPAPMPAEPEPTEGVLDYPADMDIDDGYYDAYDDSTPF